MRHQPHRQVRALLPIAVRPVRARVAGQGLDLGPYAGALETFLESGAFPPAG